MNFGLKDKVIEQIQNIFSHYETIESAIIYGSRAKGNYTPGSDIDLTFTGEGLTLSNSVYPVMDEIEDLLLPYTFDISILASIENQELIDHINRVGKVFYRKDSLTKTSK